MLIDLWLWLKLNQPSVAVVLSMISVAIAYFVAINPKIDSEYNLCISLISKNNELWAKLKTSNSEDYEHALIMIINNVEWACIYIVSRPKILRSAPLRHLEQEITEPFIKYLRNSDETSRYIKGIIYKNSTGTSTYSAFKKVLKENGIRL